MNVKCIFTGFVYACFSGNCRGNFAAENKIVLAFMWMLYVKELLHNKPFQALHNHFKIVVPLSTALTGTRMIIVQRNHIK